MDKSADGYVSAWREYETAVKPAAMATLVTIKRALEERNRCKYFDMYVCEENVLDLMIVYHRNGEVWAMDNN